MKNEPRKTDGPTVIYYRENGSVEEERWYLNDKFHRADGPAYVYYRNDGSVKRENWYLNGKYHRTDGPAVVVYRKNGSVELESWYLNSEYIDPEEHLIPAPETEEEKIELINKFVFINENNDYIFIKEWLRRDKEFYDKYKILM